MESESNVGHVSPVRGRRTHYWLCVAALLGIALLFWAFPYLRVLPLLWAKPTIRVDYLAECNRISKPEGYDPNQNAEPYYEKLFAEFKPLPPVLADRWRIWPDDLNSAEADALKAWAPVNETALTHLAAGARQPCWWYDFKSSDGSLAGIKTPHVSERRLMAQAAVLLARFKAKEGDIDAAFGLLLDLREMGVQCSQTSAFLDQLVGLAICRLADEAVLDILDRCAVPVCLQSSALQMLNSRNPQIRAPWFCRIETYYMYDWAQRVFTDDGTGNGRLIPGRFCAFEKQMGKVMPFRDAARICAGHPDRLTTLKTYDGYFIASASLAAQTPWQIRSRGAGYEERLQESAGGNYIVDGLTSAFARMIQLGWTERVEREATAAAVATLVCRSQKGQLPQSLDQLVTSGLLKQVPMDPFSNGPLVYQRTADTFTLYSVGEDLKDDDGKPVAWGLTPGDHVFWPVRPSK